MAADVVTRRLGLTQVLEAATGGYLSDNTRSFLRERLDTIQAQAEPYSDPASHALEAGL
jgi:hypothetical protein